MDDNQQKQQLNTQPQPVKRNFAGKTIAIIAASLILVLLVGTVIYIRTAGRKDASIPLQETFYYATLDSKPVIFFKDKEMAMAGVSANPYSGKFISFDKAAKAKHQNEQVDFRKLKDPKKLFSYERWATIENFVLSEDKSYLVMSYSGGLNDATNYIYQTNLKTAESKKIWEHELFSGDAPYNGGTAYITNFVPDKYVAYAFIKGELVSATPPDGVVIKNIETGAEKILGAVGDLQIDVAGKTVSFKQLGKVKAPCEQKDPQCFPTDTYKLVYMPGGSPTTQPLP